MLLKEKERRRKEKLAAELRGGKPTVKERIKQKLTPQKPKIVAKLEEILLFGIAKVISYLTVKPIHQMMIYNRTEDALEIMDAKSRIIFPTVFSVMMLIYWSLYLYILLDDFPTKLEQ